MGLIQPNITKYPILAASLVAFSSVCHAGAILKATHGDTHNLQPRAMDIRAQADGAFAKTTVTVLYANANPNDIEADFLYSAPKGSIVTGFAYWCGKERVEGRIVDRERATKIYAAATNAGGSPALVEMRGKNLFRARIRPIKARQDLRVELRLVAPLDRENDVLAWNYPIQSDTRAMSRSTGCAFTLRATKTPRCNRTWTRPYRTAKRRCANTIASPT